MFDVIVKEILGLVEESYYTRHVYVRGYGYFVRAVSTFRYRARALIAFLARFSSNSPRRRLLVTDSAYPVPERRSLDFSLRAFSLLRDRMYMMYFVAPCPSCHGADKGPFNFPPIT